MVMAKREAERVEGVENQAAKKQPGQGDQVASLIAPGGVFAKEEDHKPVRRGPTGTTYADAFPGVLPSPEYTHPILHGHKSIYPHEASAMRVLVREPPESWKESFKKPEVSDPTAATRAWRRQHRTREEQESRWRRWIKQKQREGNPEVERTSLSGTVVSSIPAGLRPAKCIGDSFPDGIRLPLFGEDTPLPIWTTLAETPWLDGKRNPAPKPPDESPWLLVNDPTHPLHSPSKAGKPPGPGVAVSGRSRCPSTAKSVATCQSARTARSRASRASRASGASGCQEGEPRAKEAEVVNRSKCD